MKIVIYCQHVLGVGHFFRTLEIARAMNGCEVILVTGGEKVDVRLPDHVRQVCLPGLMMNSDFTELYSSDPEKSVAVVKEQRQAQLLNLIKREMPDLFFVELYPFGRRAFRFELIPVLSYLKTHRQTTQCRVVCSLRDILVEKKDPIRYETRVINALNQWFDAVLVHSDPELIRLDTTFSQLGKIQIPVVYTGFVTPLPDPETVDRIRQSIGLGRNGQLIVASAGGGNVGGPLLRSVAEACRHLTSEREMLLKIYTGPYLPAADKAWLQSFSNCWIQVAEFSQDFVSLLAAADLSISMAGYNTCMNIVAAKVPALVWPFNQNREQKIRAMRIARFTCLEILEDADLTLPGFSKRIESMLNQTGKRSVKGLNISGAANTMKWIRETLSK